MVLVMSQLNYLITRVPLTSPRAAFHFHSFTHDSHILTSNLSPLKSKSFSINSQTTTSSRTRSSSIIPVRAMASSSSLEETVKKAVADNPVVVYSKTWCSFSMEVKSLFKELGVEPFVIELDEMGSEGAELQNVLARLTGQRTVPNVFIGSKHIGGCTETFDLYDSGELESLLADAGAKKSES